jgi:glycosyltransferase involved in cell wall biosynthesis
MTQRVRVAQVITRFIAGAGGVALRGALALDRSRFNVTFLTGAGDRLVDQAREAGFEVVILTHLHSDLALAQERRGIAELVARLRAGRFDVVHTHSSKAGALGRVAARHVGVARIVHTYHGFPFHQFQSPARRAAYVSIERALARVTDQFLAVGPAVAAEAIRRRIVPPDRVRTIGVALDTAAGPPTARARAEARRLLGVPPGMRVVGTVGRLDYQKAPEDFVAALARLDADDVLGVWIGDGPLRASTERLAARHGLSGRMFFAGERPDVPILLPGLDVFAMASRYEGLPCAVVEAMVAGLPVVATAVNSVPDIVVAGETGLLVPAGRPEALSRALQHVLDNPALAARLGSAGRAHLGDELTPAALGQILDETYLPLPPSAGPDVLPQPPDTLPQPPPTPPLPPELVRP